MRLLGIDIGKHSVHLHGQDAKGQKKSSAVSITLQLAKTFMPAKTKV